MGITISEELNGVVRKQGKKNPNGTCKEREKMKMIKETRQQIARIANELYRRKTRRKATNKEKGILKVMKEKFGSEKLTNNMLREKKENLLDFMRTEKNHIRRYKKKS